MEHWAKKLFEKLNPTLVQNTFAHFWERFWAIMEVWKIFHFLKTFRRLDPPWNTGQKKFSKKLPQNMFKTRLDTFGNDFVQLWNFEKFLIFWKHFEDSTIHGTLGKKNFRKNYLKTCSKRVWTLLGTILCNYEILKVFWFFKKHFEDSTLHGTLGKNFFRKNYLKTCSKHVWTLLGTILCNYEILKNFWFFENISKTRPSMEHWAKIFFGKITPKLVQNTFGQFGNDFGHFWKVEKFLVFLQRHFEDSTLHGTLGKNFFRKNYPENMFKTRLRTFGNDFGLFWIFESFLIF